MQKSYYMRHVIIPMEYKPLIEKFDLLISKDKKILETIDEKQKKKGLFSPAIRYLIEAYVKIRWVQQVEKPKQQEEVVEIKNERTKDIN